MSLTVYRANKGSACKYQNRFLRVRVERPPEVDRRYATAGRVLDYVGSLYADNPNAAVECTWQPEFAIKVTEASVFKVHASVIKESVVSWRDYATQKAGKAVEQLQQGLLGFRRQ